MSVAPPAGTHLASPDGVVSIVLPAKDEEQAIGHVLRSLPLATLSAMGLATEVVVLDGRSRDATAALAWAAGARVLTDEGTGKGDALRGARASLRGGYVVMLDADGTYAADAIPRVVDLLVRGDADVVMGRRVAQPGAMSGVHRAGNTLLSLGASALYTRRCRDVCTGLWGFRTRSLRALPLHAHGFELEAEMFALSSRLGLRIATVPVDYLPRLGRAKLAGLRDGWRIASCLVRMRAKNLRPQGERSGPAPAPGGPSSGEVRV